MNFFRKLTKDVFFIGDNDRRLEKFENMFHLPQGVSYNSYMIVDEKIALIDGVDPAVAEQFYENIRTVLNGRPLAYFVIQHVEPDHGGTIEAIVRQYPDVRLVMTDRALKMLNNFFQADFSERTQIVKEGDRLELGHHTLEFIMAPNVHWPEVMVTYDHYDKSLYTADAFGSFKAFDGQLFADEVNYELDWLAEARRYYINIVGRQGASVMRLLEKAGKLQIERINPLHGLIFRTPETINYIIEKYQAWASYTPEEEGIVLAYASMYGNTKKLNEILAAMLAERGVKNIHLYDVSKTDFSFLIADLFRFSHAVFTCLTYNTLLYPLMEALLRDLAMLNYQNRKITLLENKSWGGRALAIAEEILAGSKNLEMIGEPFKMTSSLAESQLPELEKLADQIAASFKH